jgi:hypothetical protein
LRIKLCKNSSITCFLLFFSTLLSTLPFLSPFLFVLSLSENKKRRQLMKDKPREEKRGEEGRWAKMRRKEKVK